MPVRKTCADIEVNEISAEIEPLSIEAIYTKSYSVDYKEKLLEAEIEPIYIEETDVQMKQINAVYKERLLDAEVCVIN